MCDMSQMGGQMGKGMNNFLDPEAAGKLPLGQRLAVGAGRGALGMSRMKLPQRNGAQSPMGQPNSTQAPQGSSTNDDMPNQMPGFGYRPQQGGFGDEDFLRKYFSGGMGGSQGFNA